MSNNVYVMEAANIFCGDENPDKSNHLTVSELKLPGLEENYADHLAGGAPVGIEIETHMNKLEATFSLTGWNPLVMTMIGQSSRAQKIFTCYGVIRDRRSGAALEAKAVMEGRLGRVNPQAWRRGDSQHHEYAIRGIVSYQLYMDGVAIYLWDFFLNQRIIGGVDINADINDILRIPFSAG